MTKSAVERKKRSLNVAAVSLILSQASPDHSHHSFQFTISSSPIDDTHVMQCKNPSNTIGAKNKAASLFYTQCTEMCSFPDSDVTNRNTRFTSVLITMWLELHDLALQTPAHTHPCCSAHWKLSKSKLGIGEWDLPFGRTLTRILARRPPSSMDCPSWSAH
jgi:hypothetical protein